MQMGLYTREGKHLVGRIGDLALSWDRHAGGKLGAALLVDGKSIPLGNFTISAQLEEITLCTAADLDPRLIPVEAGPHRLALRAVQRLYDGGAAAHLGDAMQETWAWADGSIYINAMLRLVDPDRGGALVEAAADLQFAAGWTPAPGAGIRLVHDSGYHVAVIQGQEDCPWAVPLEAEDPWESLDGQPPFYRRWGPYYTQWGGAGGWAATKLEDGPKLRAIWATDQVRQRNSIESFHGTLTLLVAADAETLEQKIAACQEPAIPVAEGGKVLYYSPMEGTTVVRKTASQLKLTFPAGAAKSTARLHICGLERQEMLRLAAGSTLLGFPLSDGGAADDPNGPNLLRPDDPHGPILTDADLWPDEVLTTVPLATEHQTQLEVSAARGVQLACQKWDERQNLLLFSSAHPQGNLGSLSLRDLKMRDLKIPGHDIPLMARLPLYWFQANAHSAHHCLNQPQQIDLIENGPDAVHFRIVAQNPAGTVQSDIEVRIPFLEDRLRLDMVCRFTALQRWDLAEIQYCNFFPEENREPDTWHSDRVLALADDGQYMRIDHRAAGESRLLSGTAFHNYEDNLFIALYGGPHGNVFALSRPRQIEGAKPVYQLCNCWLDNHFILSAAAGEIAAGTSYEVELSLMLARTSSIDTDIEALGRQALETGTL